MNTLIGKDLKGAVLLIGGDPGFQNSFREHFQQLQYRVEATEVAEQVLPMLKLCQFDAIVVELVAAGGERVELLRQIKQSTTSPIIVLCHQCSVESAVAAMKLGVRDVLVQPITWARIETAIRDVARRERVSAPLARGVAHAGNGQPPVQLLGESPAMRQVLQCIDRSATSSQPVLIVGESGTGKLQIARTMHDASTRANRPLLVAMCGMLPDAALERDLFGYQENAFSGATSDKAGMLEAANGGTVLIAEVGEMSLALQAKLVRFLETGLLRREGGTEDIRSDVRIVATTHRDLQHEVNAGRFREDLFYRLDVIRVQVPPLRKRDSDVLLLARHFAGPRWSFDAAAMDAIQHYDWPGNVRQLINAIERARLLADDFTIRLPNLPPDVKAASSHEIPPLAPDDFNLDSLKRHHIHRVMIREKWNKVRAARALGVSRRSLYRLLEKYRIENGQNGTGSRAQAEAAS